MKAPIRFERVTDETEHRTWDGHGSWPDHPYMGLSEFEKFFFIDPGPRRIVQEYSYNRHSSEEICPRCNRRYYDHGMLTETFFQGRSNISMRSSVCPGDSIVQFDSENFAATDHVHYDMTAEDWADWYRWKVWLIWRSISTPLRALRRRFRKKRK